LTGHVLIAPLHCFYLLLIGFLLGTTTVLTTSTARTCTYTAVRYCSITELTPLFDEDEDGHVTSNQNFSTEVQEGQNVKASRRGSARERKV